MIPRFLVPRDARALPPTGGAAPRRLTTLLDDRTVVAANLPHLPLETRSSIPSHMPLDVLASRVVVPRDMPMTPLDPASVHPDYAPLTILDHRITVPAAMPAFELQQHGQVAVADFPDVLEADVLTTGEVNLMVEPIEAPAKNWNWIARSGSIAAHVLFLSLLLLQSKLFPYRAPTDQQIDIARKQLSFIYMPPDVRGVPRLPPAPRPSIRVDPRILRRIAPPSEPKPLPGPKTPERVLRDTPVEPPPELPPAPSVQVQPSDKPPDFLRGTDASKPQPSNSTPANRGLVLPRNSSPGRTLEESAQEAMRGGGATQGFGGQLPGGPGGGGGDGLGGAVQMLTPTEGVDFTNYLARVVASVKRNWYSIMPESARLGDKGRVMLQFRILRDGKVPDAEPQLISASGKDPLDRASMSSIRASSPFEPLPPAFSGPYIELRFIFLYNLPLNTQ